MSDRANGSYRRILVIAGRSGECPFTIRFADLRYCALTAGVVLPTQPASHRGLGCTLCRPRQPLAICRDMCRHHPPAQPVGGSLAQKERSGRQRRALSEGKAQGRYLSFRPDAEWGNLDSDHHRIKMRGARLAGP